MKKKILWLSLAAIASAAVTVLSYDAMPNGSITLTPAQLANVEALSQSESTTTNPNIAYGFEMVDCFRKVNGKPSKDLVGSRCERSSPEFDCDYNRQWGNCGD